MWVLYRYRWLSRSWKEQWIVITYDNNHVPQYHRRFIASWWGSEAIQGTLCPLGSQTLEQHVVKHQVTKSRHSHLKHQPNKGSKRRRARNQQHKWFQRCNFVTMNISRFLASELSPSTQKPSWRASEPPVQGQRRPTVFGFPTSSSTQSIEPLAYAYAWCSNGFQSVSWLMPKKSQSVQQHKSLPSHETGGKSSCLRFQSHAANTSSAYFVTWSPK